MRTFQRQSSPMLRDSGIPNKKKHKDWLVVWNVGSEHHLVMSASATIGRDLRLDTFNVRVFLKKKRMSNPSMARRYCSLRQRIDFGLVGLIRPSRLTTRPHHSEGQLNDGSFYLRLLRRDFRAGTQLADQRSRPPKCRKMEFQIFVPNLFGKR